jgi:Xaa-Pro dipeptidase
MGVDVSEISLDELYKPHLEMLSRRTARSLAASSFDALVIHAGSAPTQFMDDQDYPFKVNPQFKAWVPIVDNPRCVLLFVPGSRLKVLFYQPQDYWHKPAPLPREPWTEQVELIPAADRAVKTPYELECLRRASALGARGHLAALAAFRRGASEYETHMRYLEACGQREEEMPYNNIVAYNGNAAVLHYQHLERAAPQTLRSFLIDAGAQYRGYASDITRSYASGSGRFADLIEAVESAQQTLCAQIISGRDYREVHLAAHRILGDVLRQIGLTRIPGQAALEAGVTRVFFPHGIGHLLGLQVHDVGGIMGDVQGAERKRPEGHPHLRLTRMLEPGVVVTVEPGIYLIDSLLAAAHADERRAHIDWAVVEELKPFGGVRIEDNVVATASIPENMTRDAFAAAA